MDFDLLDEVMKYLSISDIIRNIGITCKDFRYLCKFVKPSKIYDLTYQVSGTHEARDHKIHTISHTWPCIKFKYICYDRQDPIDMAKFTHIVVLHLTKCSNILNINSMSRSRCHELNLSNCYNLINSDLIHLKNIHNLNIGKCVSISNIDPIKNIHTLNIGQTNILDYSNINSSILYMTHTNPDIYICGQQIIVL